MTAANRQHKDDDDKPFGNDDPDVDDRVLEHVLRYRVSPGSCPYAWPMSR